MNRILNILTVFMVGFLLMIAVIALLAFIWHHIEYKYIYQFVVSCGLVVIGLLYLFISGFKTGDFNAKILWGLGFIVLSPIIFLLTNEIFWPDNKGIPKGFVDFLLNAHIGPDISVIFIALISLLCGNGFWITREANRNEIIGGNIILIGVICFAYLTAYKNGFY